MANKTSLSNCFASSSSESLNCQKRESLEVKYSPDNKYFDALPRSIPIIEKNYSLEPDMATGWMPKIKFPSPVPIRFDHWILDALVQELQENAKTAAKLVYLGPRLVDSLEIHEKYAGPTTYNFQVEQFFPFKLKALNAIIKKQRRDLKNKINRSFTGMNPNFGGTVNFNSDFESGNLDMAIEVDVNEYDLFMRVDTNTRGHFSWYYFKIGDLAKGQKIKVNICNFTKQRCLYERGMKPYMQSQQAEVLHQQGWLQGGENVKFSEKRLRFPFLYKEFPKYFILPLFIKKA